ncbi:MAG: hypothetical protein M1308_23940 [Actinobacteria bacterium]|nr:hypothetical protein [Actinomycetota bacterium]
MKFIFYFFVIFLSFTFLFSKEANAIYNPISTENNKFGIHILEETDIEDASRLVNSKGGSWGYVTLVIRDDQLNYDQWKVFFKKLRQNNLIPIVRLATHVENGVWVKPKIEDAQKWANFLNNLPWPIENRYIILFNEPNHAKEWGGDINPSEYSDIAEEYFNILKNKSKDFFIMNAGFDMAASNIKNETADAVWYLNEIYKSKPDLLNKLDGWVSHSYPNPGFISNPYNLGRVSIAGYRFEQEYLKNNFNVDEKPVFVTETGWIVGANGLNPQTAASYYRTAFESVWTDKNLIAVTPFLLYYPENLFSSFSWKNEDGTYKDQYEKVLGLEKEAGNPQLAPVTHFGKLIKKYKDNPQKLSCISIPYL